MVTASSAGTAYRLLIEQSKHARRKIGPPRSLAPRADGVYQPQATEPCPGGAVLDPDAGPGTDVLTLGLFGDSTAAGLGCATAAELPGVRLARGLADETGRPVRLHTYAVVGANSTTLDDQISRALSEQGGRAPDAAVIFIGANDVTSKQSVQASADRLGAAVARLRGHGTAVVAGTCPDLGAVRPIPQPLRSVVRSWSLRLAKAQSVAITAAGGCAVPLADLLSPEFLTRPEVFFSADQFHPSAAGYEAAATLMLPAVCSELGLWGGPPLAELPLRSVTAEARRPTSRLTAALNQNLDQRARTGGRWATELLRRADVQRRGEALPTDQ
ncbi:SGNH/GDSL hydrolase family protein [Rhodococcus sp. X156]|uniref:SGNH/GDSL hydrolase family protein n=1 Tax=Rhodococcus sp. X156 TaxID=2499145 RepID=UPI001F494979|nr:SGNH/GDSL hydrolase family protein [Rhodococcus sp. X156]